MNERYFQAWLIALVAASAPLMLNGCASSTGVTPQSPPSQIRDELTAAPAPSPLILADSVLEEHKGDVDALYKSWIAPFQAKNGIHISHVDTRHLTSSEEAIRSGFTRFCVISGGAVAHTKKYNGDEYRCVTPAGAFIGQFKTERYAGNNLVVMYDSAKQIAQRERRQRDYANRKSKNGPTGWIVTQEGKFRFLRLGNLNERHVIEVQLGPNSGESVPIEEVLRLDFHSKCCDFDVKLRDGRMMTLNHTMLYNRRPDVNEVYGGGRGSPVVVVDPVSEQPYTRIFEDFKSIKIEIDQNRASWDSLSADPIKTTFNITSQSRVDEYVRQLRREAHQLYSEATGQGWIRMLPDGKLTPRLMEHLQNELNGIARDPDCRHVDVINGVSNLQAPLRCHVALRELNLVVAGYSLVTDVTPLSSIIVLKKIKNELRQF